jgi:DNA-binding beta-propeller fold protein YncE
MLRRVLAILLVGSAALVGGCSTDQQPEDELMVTDTPVAATAAQSPPVTVAPAGTVTALPGVVTSMAVDTATRVLAVAVRQPPTVRLYRLDELTAQPQVVTLPGPAEELRMAAAGGPLLAAVGGESQLVRIGLPGGLARSTPLDGAPVSASQLNDRTLVAMRDRKAVAVVDGGGVQRVISGSMFSADQVLAIGGRAVVLDRLRTAVFELDVNAGTVGRGLRAGQGATNAVTDRFGRVLVADTRGGALLAFSLDPLLLRQRYPVPGGPFGLAYDPARDVVWVTLTGSNEVVGYHVAGEEPQERFRFPTVEQPNSVTVDPVSGRVIIASAAGGGIQVVPT